MELVALSEVLNRVIHVYQQQNQQVTFKEFPSPKRNAEIPVSVLEHCVELFNVITL